MPQNPSPMKGVKIIRTSNWDSMTQFYRDRLRMNERDHNNKDFYHEFADFGTEIHLERVNSQSEHELRGALELYTRDPENLADFLLRVRQLPTERRVVGGKPEIMLRDPDGHIITIVQKLV